jgi:hypothetical protein
MLFCRASHLEHPKARLCGGISAGASLARMPCVRRRRREPPVNQWADGGARSACVGRPWCQAAGAPRAPARGAARGASSGSLHHKRCTSITSLTNRSCDRVLGSRGLVGFRILGVLNPQTPNICLALNCRHTFLAPNCSRSCLAQRAENVLFWKKRKT